MYCLDYQQRPSKTSEGGAHGGTTGGETGKLQHETTTYLINIYFYLVIFSVSILVHHLLLVPILQNLTSDFMWTVPGRIRV